VSEVSTQSPETAGRGEKRGGGTEKQVEVRGWCSWAGRAVHREDRDSTQSCQRKG